MLRSDTIVILIAAIPLGGMLAYYAISGNEIPLWQALAVGVVNLLAAGKLFLNVQKAKRNQALRDTPRAHDGER